MGALLITCDHHGQAILLQHILTATHRHFEDTEQFQFLTLDRKRTIYKNDTTIHNSVGSVLYLMRKH